MYNTENQRNLHHYLEGNGKSHGWLDGDILAEEEEGGVGWLQ